MGQLEELLRQTRAESRAALAGYLPAGYPNNAGSKDMFAALLDGGCDLVEVGVPFSDPVLDGPTIQQATSDALHAGFRLRDLFGTVESVAARGGKAVVMTYWNPVYAYGVERFSRDLAAAGGLGVITPDLVPDEAADWLAASAEHGLDRIFLLAPSSTEERIVSTLEVTSGFVYATSVMGVTGARDAVSDAALPLVNRIRTHTDLPIGVGLGIRSGTQAAEVGAFADVVIVGAALVSRVPDGAPAVAELAAELAAGVRTAVTPA